MIIYNILVYSCVPDISTCWKHLDITKQFIFLVDENKRAQETGGTFWT